MKNFNIGENNNEINTEIKSSKQYPIVVMGDNNTIKEEIKGLDLSGSSLKTINVEDNDNTNSMSLSKLSSICEKKRKAEINEELKRKKGNQHTENKNDEIEEDITNERDKTEQMNEEFVKLNLIMHKGYSKNFINNENEKNKIIDTNIREVEGGNKNETTKNNKDELIENNINKDNIIKNNINEYNVIKNDINKDETNENNVNEDIVINNNLSKNEVHKNNIKGSENIKKIMEDCPNVKINLKDDIHEKGNYKENEDDKDKIENSNSEVDKKETTGNLKYFIDYNKYRNKNNVAFSMKYKDSCVSLSSDKLTCYGDKGWSSVFVNSGADVGKWYYEIKIEQPIQNLNFLGYKDKVIKVNSYIRVGFACRYMRYDYPIGTDKYSYCVNSKNGKIFNNSVSYDCMEPLKVGDIVGCYLNLKNKNTYKFDPRSDKKLYEYLQNGILCDPKNPPILKKNYGSSIFFSLNGQIKKNSFVDIYEGFYHPSVSLYMGACAKINLGPHFTYKYLKDYNPCILMEQPSIL
ncbi:SPRY domain, putative [Plasmodium gallinaceum]|uniref:SPRY domain, putative n=1 Tax=Plasmodium gallinaceum TaxID=5849 RepID=A0A1J1GM69_PLAGA|nr:SPRY domain, putative [Plasmodium gallinaceum]CRG93489.1 SPRY domain, putative [Plasmodium gallinaceum]